MFASDLPEALPKRRDWVIEDLLEAGTVAVLAGHPKHGKGYLAKQVAYSLASGEPFLDRFKVPKRGRTLYIDANANNPAELNAELKTLFHDRLIGESVVVPGISREDPRIDEFRFPDPESKDRLCRMIRKSKARYVVLDDFESVRRRDDDRAAYGVDKEAMASIRSAAQETRAGILVVLHLRKLRSERTIPTFQDLSGTAALRGESDTNMVLWDGGKIQPTRPGILKIEGRGFAPVEMRLQRYTASQKQAGYWYPVSSEDGGLKRSPVLSARDRLILSFCGRERSTSEIADYLEQKGIRFENDDSVRVLLNRMRKTRGLLTSPRSGVWRAKNASTEAA